MLPSGCVYVLISEQIQNQEVPPQLPSIQGTEPQRVKVLLKYTTCTVRVQ